MDETELEEGEARFDDNDANIDPDTALSYIDQRLQFVLGHFQKDFGGELSAEILGPKFGEYGSFLPAQKNFPTVHSHSRALNSNKPCSPYNFHLGVGAPINSVNTSAPVKAAAPHHGDAFVDQNALSADNLASKDTSLLHGETFLSRNETSASNAVNPTGQRSLKVRIKVGSDKSARKNDEIYGGLGLLSSSSNTTEDSGGPPIEPHDIPFNSPGSILRDMTSIFVPGNRLLSPLNESLICLGNKVIAWTMGRKTSSLIVVDDSSPVLGDGRQMEIKEVTSLDKSEIVEGMKCKNSAAINDDMASYSGKCMETESLDSKRCLTNDYKVRLSSGSMTSEANQAAKKFVPVKKREAKRDLISEQLFGPDFTGKESDESFEQKNINMPSLDSTGSGGIKGNMVHSVCKSDTDVTKHETHHFEKKVGPKATTCESLEVKVPQRIDKLPFERKIKLKSIQSSDISKENSRSGRCGAMKEKKSALKDIVKLRNSYKDILDTMAEEPDMQTKPLQMPTGNGPIKVENVESIVIPAEVVVSQMGPAAPPDNWVGCDRCEKWRLLPIGIEPDNLPEKWLCSMSTWLPGRNHCDISEDETTRAVQEINFQLISRNQANIRLSENTNSFVNSDSVANKFQKNKSRPEGSCSSLIETNQPLPDKNFVNKPIDMERHAAKVNGGDLKPKKLKSKTESDQYDTANSNKIKSESGRDMVQENQQVYSSNGDHRPRDKLIISVKRQAESTQVSMSSKLLDKVEIHAKKRKLEDWQESQPYENTLESNEDRIGRKEKRFKACNTEVKDKVKTMKIKLSGSKENLVDTSHEKNQHHKEKVACKKDLESQRFLLATTSSSSKISGSCRRGSLQERKGSPVGSVSSSPIRALNLDKLSPAAGRTISRKGHAKSATATEFSRKLLVTEDNMKSHNRSVQDLCNIDASQRFGSKVEVKQTEDGRKSMKRDANGAVMIPKSLVKGSSSSRSKDKDERRFGSLTDDQLVPNKKRRIELDVEVVGDGRRKHSNESSAKTSNDVMSVGKKISKRRTSDGIGHEKAKSLTEESKLGDMGSVQVNPTVKKDSKKDLSRLRDQNMVEPKVDATPCSAAKQSESKFIKHHGDAAAVATNQNSKSLVTDYASMKNLSVIGFLKEHASSQTALTAFKRAEESKDYAERLKISGFDYECNDGYFDSALKFLYAASLLEGCTTDLSKSKGTDPTTVYNTSAKLSKICAQEYEKRKEMAVAALAYKCMEVACMRIVYCKSLVTKQDLQTSLQMVTQGDSPSSSASDVDNLNNQATMDKTMMSKSIPHPGNHVLFRNQANFTRLLDFTSDVSLAMEASMKSQHAYKAASAILEAQNKEMMISVKRVVDFSFQDVKEVVSLVQNAREAINRRGLKGNNRQN